MIIGLNAHHFSLENTALPLVSGPVVSIPPAEERIFSTFIKKNN